MFERIGRIADSGSDLFESQARIALARTRKAGAALIFAAITAAAAAVFAGLVVASLLIFIAGAIGWPWALLCIGSVGVIACGLAAAAALAKARDAAGIDPKVSIGELQAGVAAAKARFRRETGLDKPEQAQRGAAPALPNLKSIDPAIVAGATVALIGLFGPTRLVRGLWRIARTVGLASAATEIAATWLRTHARPSEHARSNGAAARPAASSPPRDDSPAHKRH